MKQMITNDGRWKLDIFDHTADNTEGPVYYFHEVVLRENTSRATTYWTGWGATIPEAIADSFRVKEAEEVRKMMS
jgi:hypothetical protein